MRTETIAGKRVEYYDSIEDLPNYRFSKWNAWCAVDAGAGSDMADLDRKMSRIYAKLKTGDNEGAAQEVANFRQGFRFVISELSPKMMSFAVMVKSINDKSCNDMTDNALKEVVKILSKEKTSFIYSIIERIKKKINEEVNEISRSVDTNSMLFFGTIKEETRDILNSIIENREPNKTLEYKIEAFGAPVKLFGESGAEAVHEQSHMELDLAISKHFNKDTKQMTAKEALYAITELKEQVKRNNKKH